MLRVDASSWVVSAFFGSLLFLALSAPAAAQNLTIVPPGNRNVEQPEIPSGAVSRTRATNGSFQAKYEKIRDLIARNGQLQRKIKNAATRYNIDPVHIVGALIGEHTYNVDALDHLQTYLVKAASYLGSDLTFQYEGEKVTDFVQRPEFAPCFQISNSYDLWSCRENIWDTAFRGQTIGGKTWPNNRFGRVFFQPLFAGQTFGLGQLNPLAALRVNDVVMQTSRLPRLNAEQAPQIYETIMDPDTSLDYMAAVIRVSIDAYASIAGMDISNNPGITATLYNLGDVRSRAIALRDKIAAGEEALPQENYYGWLVNEKIAELNALVR